MNDQTPDNEDTQRIPSAETTHRYGAPGPGERPPYSSPQPYGAQTPGDPHEDEQFGGFGFHGQADPHEPRRSSRPSGGFTAGLLVGALVLGGLGGLAGAAGFAAVDNLNANDDVPATSSPALSDPTVAERDDPPAEPGSIEDVANSVLPSVVKINVTGAQGEGSGSGIILSSDGEILTNYHVVEVAAEGGSLSVSFNDGSAAEAEIVGTDPVTDLAVIKAQDVSGLTPANLDRSGEVDVGEEVVAIGSPFGLEATVTSGIVSAVNRPVSVGRSSATSMDTTYPAIQTDASINPGNSGGPLVDMRGEVVGVNSSIRSSSSTGTGGSIGLGFAIPIAKVLPIVEQLRSGEAPTHARLGVTVADASSDNGLLTGAGISTISDGSAAAESDLQVGDVVTKVNDEIISDSQSLVATIRGFRPGDTVTLTVVRDGDDTQAFDVTLDSDEGAPTS